MCVMLASKGRKGEASARDAFGRAHNSHTEPSSHGML